MLLRLDNPDHLPELLGHLRGGIDVVAAQVTDRELRVGLLGSRSEASQRRELEARLVGWRRDHPDARLLLDAAA